MTDDAAPSSEELLSLVYDELHRQAHRHLRRERYGHTLQTTALVNEVYLKLSKTKNAAWQNRTHFLAVASKLMRQVLIDYARAKYRAKRGGPDEKISLDSTVTIGIDGTDLDLIALDEVLTRLAGKDPYLASVVELRFFSGLSVAETAGVLNVSESTVHRDWQMAKAWLHRELTR